MRIDGNLMEKHEPSNAFFFLFFIKFAPNGELYAPGQGGRVSPWTPRGPNLLAAALTPARSFVPSENWLNLECLT